MSDPLPSTLAPSVLTLVACPVCWKTLVMASGTAGEPIVACSACGRQYPIVDGIPVLIPDRAV